MVHHKKIDQMITIFAWYYYEDSIL